MNGKGNTIPITKARNDFLDLIRKVADLHKMYFITKKGRTEAVILNVEEFESWVETVDILSNKAEIKVLKQAEKEMKQGKGRTFKETFGEELN